jgi:hypothetical protein
MMKTQFRQREKFIAAIIRAGFFMENLERLSRVLIEGLFEVKTAQHKPGITAELSAQSARVGLPVGYAKAGPFGAYRVGAAADQDQRGEEEETLKS